MTASTDTSCRYVLSCDAPLVRNLSALWAVNPELAARVEAIAEPYPVEASKAGLATIALPGPSQKPIYLHSRYQPLDDARRLIENINFDQKIAFFVHGLGLGYHLQMLFDKASEDSLICLFEPDLRLLRTALEHCDLSKLIESRQLLFFDHADKGELFGQLQPRTALLAMGMESVIHAPSLQLHENFHRQLQTWITEFASVCRTNLNTLVLNGRRTAENLTRNIGWYIATPSISRLQDRYKNTPAIIVSAGPSLRKNKHLLKNADGKAVFIAVQTTLQPLVDMGIRPHFATSLDYHDICTRFFEKLPKDITTELVAEPKATNAIFKLNPGPLSLLGNEFSDALIKEMKPEKMRLKAGATVAHLAFYLAEHLGCNPIIFVGQDLGFTDGLCYTPGTSYEEVWRPELSQFCTMEMKQWEQIVRDRHILRKVPDQQGRPMYTEERLFSYLQQFERDFARSDRHIIDATEGGALKHGSEILALAQTIEKYCTHPITISLDQHPGLCWDRLEEARTCLKNRAADAERIEDISNETLPLLQEVSDHLDDQSRVNRLIGRIDKLRAKMDELGNCYDLILQLTQLTELRRFQQDCRINSSKLSAMEKQKRQVKRDIENVKAIIEAAREFQDLMRQVAASLKRSNKEAA